MVAIFQFSHIPIKLYHSCFRSAGDAIHLISIVYLLVQIWRTKSCSGVSGKSQLLLLLAYVTRHLDLFSPLVLFYDTLFKALFIEIAVVTVYLIYFRLENTYDRKHDTFIAELLVVACLAVSLVFNYNFSLLEVLWTFSVFLESVAMIPQLTMMLSMGRLSSSLTLYLAGLLIYRTFYAIDCVYRLRFGYFDPIFMASGGIQMLVYLSLLGFSLLFQLRSNAISRADGGDEEARLHCDTNGKTEHMIFAIQPSSVPTPLSSQLPAPPHLSSKLLEV